MRIAVVIVSYKSAALAVRALQSVADERSALEADVKAVVVDNSGIDGASVRAAILARGWAPWASVVQSPYNGGFAYGNNRGIEFVFQTGGADYVYLLNPDTEVRPGAIGVLVRFMEDHPEAGIAGGSFENADGSDWPMAFRFPSLLGEVNEALAVGVVTRVLRRWVVPRVMTREAQPVDWICGAAMLVRAEVLAAIGGLDEGYFLYFEETDFCRRARQAGFRTWYVPDSRVMHIAGQSTQVTDPTLGPRRLPGYWFESRRRYFSLTFGTAQAIAIDAAAVVAGVLGHSKRWLLRRRSEFTPHYLRDIVTHSSFRPKHWTPEPARSGTVRALAAAWRNGTRC